ncbi:CMRF35-like molecule 9 isoform X22 [Castor canadensis]|uniref:CMRF35-like molecule 9 isoform X22 n=1 Tax=Castor canadensis TaxID=51338 RepID=A0AC58K9P5_CASCN
MWPLVLLWGCLVLPGYDALKGPKEISGHEGETVSVKCTYGEELRKHMKYWCRQGGILFSRCTGTIYTKGDQEVTQGRVSIRDSPQELALTVTMRHLTLQDAGKYWCGVNMLGLDETSLISLIVFPGSFRPAIQLDSTITEDTSPVPSSGSSKPSHMLRRKKKGEPAQLAMGTQRNEKVHLPASTLGNGCAPEDVVINLAGPAGPRECAAGPYTNIQCLNQKMKWGDGAQYTKVRHVGRETKKKEKKSPTISWLPGDNHDCRSHSATFPNFVLHKLCDVLLTE